MLEISGILKKVSNIETITYGEKSFKKLTFVIEIYSGFVTETIAFDLYGEKCDKLTHYTLDLPITVKFIPRSKEVKGSWFTSLRVYEIFGEALCKKEDKIDGLPF